MSDLKEEKLTKKQTYTKTEANRVYSRVFWIFLPNVVKVDLYNFELYHFKVCAFFLRHSVVALISSRPVDIVHLMISMKLWQNFAVYTVFVWCCCFLYDMSMKSTVEMF